MKITLEQLIKDSKELASQIPNGKYESIYGVPAGGILPAYVIAEELWLPLVDEPEEGTLIVDDLVDSGKTLKNLDCGLDTATLYIKSHSPRPTHYLEQVEGWIDLPHDKETDSEDLIVRMFEKIGENPNREGLLDTPKRVVKMWEEIFRGYDESQKPKITVFDNDTDGIKYDQMILDSGNYYSQCLVGDTQIRTTKGIFKIKDLVGKNEDVFCYDEKNKKFTISRATKIEKKKRNAEVWKLTTETNTIYATPDHKFLTYTNGWVMLKDLKPNDSLVVLNSVLSDNYISVQFQKSQNGWKKEHQFIYEEMKKKKIKKGQVIHHIDCNKLNNNIDNLLVLSNKKHISLHSKMFQESLSIKEKSERGKCANRGFVNLKYTNPEKFNEVRKRASKSLKNTYKTEKGKKIRKKKSIFMTKLWKQRKDEQKMANHRVIRTEFYGYEDVYCMDVKKYHNFVANEMIVHNCEHHMVPFFGKYNFAYIPNKKILGLSKVARIVQYYSAKLQVQERLTKEIVDEIEKAVQPLGIALIMKGRHLCKEMRGIRDKGEMITSEMRGVFKEKPETRMEFLRLLNVN